MSPEYIFKSLLALGITAALAATGGYTIGHRIGYLEGNRIEGNTFCNCKKAESDIAREILNILKNYQSQECTSCVGIDAETNKFEYIPPPKEK